MDTIDRVKDFFCVSKMSSKIRDGRVEASEDLIFTKQFVAVGGPGVRAVAKIFEFEFTGKAELVANLG